MIQERFQSFILKVFKSFPWCWKSVAKTYFASNVFSIKKTYVLLFLPKTYSKTQDWVLINVAQSLKIEENSILSYDILNLSWSNHEYFNSNFCVQQAVYTSGRPFFEKKLTRFGDDLFTLKCLQ